ncbi:MAG TPA: DUF1549 domain-containing protein [Bryobacteraceae bacterium]|nr:DUF1549 domain-containing protein [Bryobacteraceae bacterium]
MRKKLLAPLAATVAALGIYGGVPGRAQEALRVQALASQSISSQSAADQECPYFGPERERFAPRPARSEGTAPGRLTRQFRAALGSSAEVAGRTRPFTAAQTGSTSTNLIDKYIFDALQSNGVTPANKTNDYEFIRRVTLDLTGRIPTAAQVTAFVSSTDSNKRATLVDQLLAKPEWVDKWTMFYGDLFKNTASTVQVQIRPEGRNAFYKWIHDSLAGAKPYNQMATELIAAQGNNNFDQTNGQLNYLVLGYVTGGPAQDIFDSQTANVADTFLGLAHVNCLLCHNGAGHLTSLSLWGGQTTRAQAWQLSAFMAHTRTRSLSLPADPNVTGSSTYPYWSLDTYTTDYQLNTTTGNRPSRQPIGTVKVITPTYFFNGKALASGQDYRTALAQDVTGDFQFARAAVNYVWAQLFGVGIVDPPDQFDPLRLDPNNPPPAPWTLQPSNPQLLNALAQSFIDSGYSIQTLMRLIVNSDTYQLASDYPGTYSPAYDQYFARKFVRRLWSEEIHDGITTAVGTLPTYTVPGFTNASTVYEANSPGFGPVSYAMQTPDVVNVPDGGGAVSQFLDVFLRGNRDDQPRKHEGSILQALDLMNDNFVQSRIHATGTGAATSFLQKQLTANAGNDTALINSLFMNVLSRNPTPAELALATAQLANGGATLHSKNAEDLLWTLFNKLDFVFNY